MAEKFPVLINCGTDVNSGLKDFLFMDFREYQQNNSNLVFPHRHNFYHMVFFTEGAGQYTIDFTNFTIQPFQVYFMIPGQVHTWDFDGHPTGFILNFSADFFDAFLLESDYIRRHAFFSGDVNDQVLQIPSSMRDQALYLLRTLLQRTRQSVEQTDYERILLLHFFQLIEEQNVNPSWKVRPPQEVTILTKFRDLVEKHFREEKFPAFYARVLQISTNHLNNICKSHLQTQAGQYIRDRVILEAKRLLIHPEHSIRDVAHFLNFNDNSYFTKFFKKSVGKGPIEFRKLHRVDRVQHL